LLLCFLTSLLSSLLTFIIIVSHSRIQPRGIRRATDTSQPYMYGETSGGERQTLVANSISAVDADGADDEEGQTI
jgi:hypothetical protein